MLNRIVDTTKLSLLKKEIQSLHRLIGKP